MTDQETAEISAPFTTDLEARGIIASPALPAGLISAGRALLRRAAQAAESYEGERIPAGTLVNYAPTLTKIRAAIAVIIRGDGHGLPHDHRPYPKSG